MPRVAEEEEQMLGGQQQPTAGMGRQQPPSMPSIPPGLSPEQLKRRHIVASLVHSENNYVASLQRLVNVSFSLTYLAGATSRTPPPPLFLSHWKSLDCVCL